MDVTIQEIHSFQTTPAAEGLSFEQCIEAVKQQKALMQPAAPEFDPVAHMDRLKGELAEWELMASNHPPERVTAAVDRLMNEIQKYESVSVG